MDQFRVKSSTASCMSPSNKGHKRVVLICVFCAAFSTLLSVFLPAVVSFGWHVLNGNSVQFGLWEIPVPWGWRVIKMDKGIVIQKLGRWNNPPSDVPLIALQLPVGSAIDHERWKNSRIESQRNDGHYFISENEVQLEGENGFCLNFAGHENSDARWIDCDFPIHRLSIGYYGSKADSQVLSLIVPKIRTTR